MHEQCDMPYPLRGDIAHCCLPLNHDDDCVTANQRQTGAPHMNPIQHAAEGARSHLDDRGYLIANDEDVLRIARAIAEHRAGLMDRLAR